MARQRLWHYDSERRHTVVMDEAKTLPCGAFRHSKNVEEVSFPCTFECLPKDCLLGCPRLTKIDLPAVKTLGERACAGCPSLLDLHLPDGPEVLPKGFLEDAKSLKKLRLPNTLKAIEALALKNATSLTELSLPDSLEHLGKDALSGCDSLRGLILPKHLKTLAMFSLPQGGLLERIEINPDNPHFICEDNVLYSNDKKTLILYPSADKRDRFVVPEGVETIGVGAFYKNKYLEKVVLAKSIKKVCRTAFGSMENLKELVFNSAPVVAGAKEPLLGAFSNCKKLHEVVLPVWQSVPPFTFAESEIVKLTLPSTLERIGKGAFYKCPLPEVVLPSSVKKVAEGAFYGAKKLVFSSLPAGYYATLAGKSPILREKWSPHILEIAGNAIWLGGGNDDMWQDLINEIDWTGDAFSLFLADQGFDGIEKEEDKRLWVLGRLKSPQALDERAKKRYVGYLKRHYEVILYEAMAKKDEKAIEVILSLVPPEKSQVDALLQKAKALGASHLMPIFLGYGGKKRSFSL